MTTQDIASIRLAQQGILERPYQTPLELIKAMGAIQAQDYYGSLWAIGLRTGLTEAQVVRAVEGQTIIRTWPQRGTLHLVPAEDAKSLVGLSAERILKGATRRHQQLSLNEDILAQSKAVVTELLQARALVPRPQVLGALEQARIETQNGRGYHILWYLAQTGVIYVGPMAAKQQTFGLLATLVPKPVEMERSQAVARLARRYFTSHGPATIQDFMWWSGLTATDAKAGLAASEAALRSEVVDGKTYWLAQDAAASDITQTTFLLPGFDEYLLGYKDRTAVLRPEDSHKVIPGGNGMFLPTVVVRGQIVGTWKRIIKKQSVQVQINSFRPLRPADKRLIEAPARAYAAFVDLPLDLVIA
jgi:hypothetical protein